MGATKTRDPELADLARRAVRALAPAARAERRLDRAAQYQDDWLTERYLKGLRSDRRRSVVAALKPIGAWTYPAGVTRRWITWKWRTSAGHANRRLRRLAEDGLVVLDAGRSRDLVKLTELGEAVLRVSGRRG
jgi:hypothetical protein